MPRAFRILSEGLLRREPAEAAKAQIEALIGRDGSIPISFVPGRALLQDFMGIPLMTDLASMRGQHFLRCAQ